VALGQETVVVAIDEAMGAVGGCLVVVAIVVLVGCFVERGGTIPCHFVNHFAVQDEN